MHSRTRKSLLAYGFGTELIKTIDDNRHTVAVLKAMSIQTLHTHYSPDEVVTICERIKRRPIAQDVLDTVIAKARGACCYCVDGNSSKPFQIHHITPYSETHDNSEDNLMLICPTHHEVVPTTETTEQQKSRRNSWHEIVQIANDFLAQGIAFPFDRLSAIDFAQPLDATQLIHDYRISPSLASALSDHELGKQCVQKIDDDKFLVIVGASGSGKSTLAVGVAGCVSECQGSHVFLFRGSTGHNFGDVQLILQCISCAKRNDILILDDANKYLSLGDLVTIAQATKTKRMNVIATWTNNQDDDPTIERHLPRWVLVTWDYLRDAAMRFLISREGEVVKAIQKYRSRDEMRAVGLGSGDIPLQVFLQRTSRGVKTAAEFFFLLRGGKETIRKELDQLTSDENAYIPVLLAAIEQIAGFEKAISVDEVINVCTNLFPRECAGIDSAWVQNVFEQQCKRGKMQRRLAGYTTIHRDYAKRLLSVAMGSDAFADATKRMMARDYECNAVSPNRWTILTSWFWYDEFVGSWIAEWATSRREDDWREFMSRVCEADLQTIGNALDWLGTICLGGRVDRTMLARELAQNTTSVQNAISSASDESWNHLKAIAWLMNDDLISPALPAERCAALLESTNPIYYDTATWLFSSMVKCTPMWVETVGRFIDVELMFAQFQRVRKGDLDVFFHFRELTRNLKIPVKRSTVKRTNEAMRVALEGAKVSEMSLGLGDDLTYLLLFPQDYECIFDAIDIFEWAREMEHSNPRDWRQIVTMIHMEPGQKTLTRVFEEVSPEAMISNIKAKYEGNEYEMRCLLWLLALASEGKRQEYVTQLAEVIRDSFSRRESERSFLYKVLSQFDVEFADILAKEFGHVPDSDARGRGNSGSEDAGSEVADLRRQCEDMDRRGVDYIIRFDRIFGDGTTNEPYLEPLE